MYIVYTIRTYVRTYIRMYVRGSPVSHSGRYPELNDSLSFAKNIKTYESCTILYVLYQQGTCVYVHTMYAPASSSVLAHFAACGRRPLTRETGTDRPKGVVRVWSEPF